MTELYIRPSGLSSWPDCTRRGASRLAPDLLEREGIVLRKTVSPVGSAVGTATHSAVAHTLRHKIEHGVVANDRETEQVGLESLTEEVHKGTRWDAVSPDLNTAQKQVIRQYKTFKIHAAPLIQPQEVERRMTTKTEAGNTLSGQPDVTDDGIHDLKTGVQQRIGVAQYGGYSLLRRSEGQPVEHLTETFVRRASIKQEQPLPVQIMYHPAFAEAVATSIIFDIEQRFKYFDKHHDKFIFLANPASQLCSQRYCAAYHSAWCPESMGKDLNLDPLA